MTSVTTPFSVQSTRSGNESMFMPSYRNARDDNEGVAPPRTNAAVNPIASRHAPCSTSANTFIPTRYPFPFAANFVLCSTTYSKCFNQTDNPCSYASELAYVRPAAARHTPNASRAFARSTSGSTYT